MGKDEDIVALKKALHITPKTATHFWGMGYKRIEDLRDECITPETLADELQAYLERTKQLPKTSPHRAGKMYTVAFRRILWAARASEKEKADHPELFTCGEWSNKALERKRAQQGTCDTKAPPAKKEKRGKRTEM